jgi:hypothetical protein
MDEDQARELEQTAELIRGLLYQAERRTTYRDFAEEISIPEKGKIYTYGAVEGWANGKNPLPVNTCILWARYGKTERVRELGRKCLAIKGLKLLDE